MKNLLAGMLGNVLEHYDNALYSLLVPFLAPLFFSNVPYLTGLIIAYGIQIVAALMRPLGAVIFGYYGDRYGRKKILSITLLGMAISTMLMGCLPTYGQIGSLAPLLLVMLRAAQNFFAGGETKGGAIFVLEHSKKSWRGFMSSIYDASSILGIVFASALVGLCAAFDLVEYYWRIFFWLGSLSALVGFVIRNFSDETPDYLEAKEDAPKILWTLLTYRKALFSIALASGFSYVSYSIPFTLMNGFLPLISSMSKAEAIHVNTSLLVFDMLLLPCFGIMTRYINSEKLMKGAALSMALCAVPLFTLLYNPTMTNALIVRTVIVIIGVAFAAPFHQWSIGLVPVKDRYLLSSLGTSLGTQCIGAPCAALCLWLYQKTDWVIVPGFYLLAASLGALWGVTRTVKKTAKILA